MRYLRVRQGLGWPSWRLGVEEFAMEGYRELRMGKRIRRFSCLIRIVTFLCCYSSAGSCQRINQDCAVSLSQPCNSTTRGAESTAEDAVFSRRASARPSGASEELSGIQMRESKGTSSSNLASAASKISAAREIQRVAALIESNRHKRDKIPPVSVLEDIADRTSQEGNHLLRHSCTQDARHSSLRRRRPGSQTSDLRRKPFHSCHDTCRRV